MATAPATSTIRMKTRRYEPEVPQHHQIVNLPSISANTKISHTIPAMMTIHLNTQPIAIPEFPLCFYKKQYEINQALLAKINELQDYQNIDRVPQNTFKRESTLFIHEVKTLRRLNQLADKIFALESVPKIKVEKTINKKH